ncbi:hypothetical protein [Fusobacterium varium]|uniref:hypothetical protein n=1 Tax=Fusobacterium varium TaxID=856 RepID=UPI0024306E93|nr:hypothetical protein [Fusobacterium varium]MCF0171908.1 hypothetical protein [Fusobacterium varium]
MTLYEINLQREILREKSAEVLSDYRRYFRKHKIDSDSKAPINFLYNAVGDIYRNIFKPEYDEYSKLQEANGKLDLARETLKNIQLEG